MSLQASSAAVVGGGIGGLAAAVALLRAGWDVRVYERAGLWLAVNIAPGRPRVPEA